MSLPTGTKGQFQPCPLPPVTNLNPDKGEAYKTILVKRTVRPTQDHADTPCYVRWMPHHADMMDLWAGGQQTTLSHRAEITDQWWSADRFVPLC